MGKNTCAVVGCWNRTGDNDKIIFFRFPKDKERKEQWCVNLGLISDNINGARQICSEHFKPKDIYFTEKLFRVNKNALPITESNREYSANINKNEIPAPVSLPIIISQPRSHRANMWNRFDCEAQTKAELLPILDNIDYGNMEASRTPSRDRDRRSVKESSSRSRTTKSSRRQRKQDFESEPESQKYQNRAPASRSEIMKVQNDTNSNATDMQQTLDEMSMTNDKNKILVECDPNCKTCKQLIQKLTQHIQAAHHNQNEIETSFSSPTSTLKAVSADHDNSPKRFSSLRKRKRINYTPAVEMTETEDADDEQSSNFLKTDEYNDYDDETMIIPEIKTEIMNETQNFDVFDYLNLQYDPFTSNTNIETTDSLPEENSNNDNSNTKLDNLDQDHESSEPSDSGKDEESDSDSDRTIYEYDSDFPDPELEKSEKIRESSSVLKEPSICTICKRSFKKPQHLEYHMFRSSCLFPEKNVNICEVCGKNFKNKHSLIRHSKCHLPKKTFDCHICHRKYTDEGNYKKHLEMHTNGKPFLCNICAKSFTKKDALNLHVKGHEGAAYSHICEVCGQGFHRQSMLKYHMWTHTGENPNVCNVCGKTFAVKSRLTRHLKIHLRKRPHVCD